MNLLNLCSRRTIQGKFFILNILLTLIPMIIISSVVYKVSVYKLEKRAEDRAREPKIGQYPRFKLVISTYKIYM
ncbi:hypothetical protein ACA29_25045 [Lederbergia galactosidilytica]|uniref:Uncharacterized protein n=1 Tax=Lederbergia galactosidilytica TaxID=217031 RepID=A0A0Q9XX04_9BACI|nr:hypothetical protein ACA29_25045 [Lederbergia galactosidilytica]